MKKNKNKPQKSTEEYRRDIFTLKKQLKQQQEHLQQLKQKYQNADVLADSSYTYSMKLKILQYTLNDIRAKIAKFNGQQEYEFYLLNFSTLALLKSCEVVGLTREMIFRAIDVQGKGSVGYFQFSSFLREVMRLDSQFINPLMKVLCPDQSKPINKQRYEHFLAAFMIKNQQNGGQAEYLQQSVTRVAKQLDRQHVTPQNIWKMKQINIAIAIQGLMKAAKNLDVLDCVACYCRCDPLKNGMINASALADLLHHRIQDSNNFQPGAVKFKLAKT